MFQNIDKNLSGNIASHPRRRYLIVLTARVPKLASCKWYRLLVDFIYNPYNVTRHIYILARRNSPIGPRPPHIRGLTSTYDEILIFDRTQLDKYKHKGFG